MRSSCGSRALRSSCAPPMAVRGFRKTIDDHIARCEQRSLFDRERRRQREDPPTRSRRQQHIALLEQLPCRGVGDLGLAPWLCPKPSLFIIASKISLYPKEYYENGLAIVTVPTRRINPAALPPTIKSLNYMNNILGKIEAKQFGALEAIMLNDQGYVAECTADNVFIVHKGEIITPSASQGALKGITRSTIIDVALLREARECATRAFPCAS